MIQYKISLHRSEEYVSFSMLLYGDIPLDIYLEVRIARMSRNVLEKFTAEKSVFDLFEIFSRYSCFRFSLFLGILSYFSERALRNFFNKLPQLQGGYSLLNLIFHSIESLRS